MHKYSMLSLGGFLLSVSFMILFDGVASITGELFPFAIIIVTWMFGLATFLLRGFVWYRKDLAERTLEQLNDIEENEVEQPEQIEAAD